ncbi:MAG: ABC transporter permease [Rhodospirillales bacterium]
MESWRKNLAVFSAFSAPPFVWLAAFFILPLGIIWFYSFGENITLVEIKTTWTLDNYKRIFVPEILTLLWRSLRLAALATVICIVAGFPVALVIASASPKHKPWLLLIVILPFWTNLLIRTYALLNILGSRGQLNSAMKWMWETASGALETFGMDPAAFMGERYIPVQFLGAEFGVVFGLVYIFLPFAVLPIYSSLERMDKSYLEASMDLGMGQIRTFFLILVPLASGGVVTAAIITFIPALGQFLIPDLLGRGQVDMLANVIERQFKKANDWPFGSALSLFLLYITFFILAARSFADAARDKKRGRG